MTDHERHVVLEIGVKGERRCRTGAPALMLDVSGMRVWSGMRMSAASARKRAVTARWHALRDVVK
jgi:hypothetical protein